MSWSSPSGFRAGSGAVCGSRSSRRALEIVGIVFLFCYFWPLAFAYLAWKTLGYPVPHELRGLWERGFDGPLREFGFRAGAFGTTGNRAFDEYRRNEIDRLEAERRRLDGEAKEFRSFVDDLKKAKDREEFDAYMARRRSGGTTAV